MRLAWLLVLVAAACDRGATCKDAITRARSTLDFTSDNAARLIGRCELDGWDPAKLRCIATASDYEHLDHCLGVAEEEMAKLLEFTNAMCACKDTACANHVSADMTNWSKAIVSLYPGSPKMSEDDAKRASEIGDRLAKCMIAAMGVP